jgi:hypothetical protein
MGPHPGSLKTIADRAGQKNHFFGFCTGGKRKFR